MAVYTTQLRTICESLASNQPGGYSQINQIIEEARPKIFDFEYPIFNPEYKSVLETKIIRHYYTQEIGLETVGLWKLKLETRMTEIMPYFNKLYGSNELQYDVLTDYSYIKMHAGESNQDGTEDTTSNIDNTVNNTGSKTSDNTLTNSGNDKTTFVSDSNDNRTTDTSIDTTNKVITTNTGSNDSTNSTAFNDTPQGNIGNVEDLNYLTSYTEVLNNAHDSNDATENTTGKNTGNVIDDLNTHRDDTTTLTHGKKEVGELTENTTSDTTNKTNQIGNKINNLKTTDSYVEKITGKLGGKSYPELVQGYRDTLLNIDLMIIKELSDLFMLIY